MGQGCALTVRVSAVEANTSPVVPLVCVQPTGSGRAADAVAGRGGDLVAFERDRDADDVRRIGLDRDDAAVAIDDSERFRTERRSGTGEQQGGEEGNAEHDQEPNENCHAEKYAGDDVRGWASVGLLAVESRGFSQSCRA